MKPIIVFLNVACLAWMAVLTWVNVALFRHAVALWRPRPPDLPLPDDFLGEVFVARALRQAEIDFSIGIALIDAYHHLSRHHRHRFDAGVPAVPGGGNHAHG